MKHCIQWYSSKRVLHRKSSFFLSLKNNCGWNLHCLYRMIFRTRPFSDCRSMWVIWRLKVDPKTVNLKSSALGSIGFSASRAVFAFTDMRFSHILKSWLVFWRIGSLIKVKESPCYNGHSLGENPPYCVFNLVENKALLCFERFSSIIMCILAILEFVHLLQKAKILGTCSPLSI